MTDVAELWARTNASFLAGASDAEEMVSTAAAHGYRALGVTDVDEVGGIIRAHAESKRHSLPLVFGAELTLLGPGALPGLVVLAKDRGGYARLCRLLTMAKRGRPRGSPGLPLDTVLAAPEGLMAIFTAPVDPITARRLSQAFGPDAGLFVTRSFQPGEAKALDAATTLERQSGLHLIATGAPRYHDPSRKPLMDVITAIRTNTPLARCGYALEANAERCLQPPARMAQRLHEVGLGRAVDRGLAFADRAHFELDSLRFVYPEKHLPAGTTPIAHFVQVVLEGARQRYGDPIPERAATQLRHELGIIERLRVEGFFLTMHDIIGFARSRGILCQGRGSAANSAVCYALGITSVDPVGAGLLFERFISEERGEPPDIDVDFEHERREEVIQFVYDFYGRDHAALVCENICYRTRSSVRDVGKALGLSLDQVDRLSKSMGFWTPERGEALVGEDGSSLEDDDPDVDAREVDEHGSLDDARLRDAGIEPGSRVATLLRAVVPQLRGFPRHRGTHVGGMVVTHEPLIDTAPLEEVPVPVRSGMPSVVGPDARRAILPWDKDDCDAIGMCKFDLLALGMLSALRRGFDLVSAQHGVRYTLATIPQADEMTYERVRAADTLGTFQIESRAQMATLPRLRPEKFYDLVVAISIIRPGPIQGGMVHPYLRRKNGEEPITFPHPSLIPILARTLGVPLFQEQVMRIAVEAAGFSPGEADELRRKMGAWRKRGTMGDVRERLLAGMAKTGISAQYAEQIFKQIQGFGEYGFPESHAISFALLAYASAWLKTHFPAEFACALLNSQPMGFYGPHTLVEDAKRHGVVMLPIDVERSDWDCTIERGAIRIGVRYVDGLGARGRERFEQAVFAGGLPPTGTRQPFRTVAAFAQRTGFDSGALSQFAHAGALRSLDLDQTAAVTAQMALTGAASTDGLHSRRAALWEVMRPRPKDPTLALPDDPRADFPPMTPVESVNADFAATGLSVDAHPVSFLRPMLARRGAVDVRSLGRLPDGRRVEVAGLIIGRQHPQTAKGFVFLSLEDETGLLNVIIEPQLFDKCRTEITRYPFLAVRGTLQTRVGSTSVKAISVHPLFVKDQLAPASRDFR